MKAHGYCPKCSTKHVSTLCPKCYSNLLVDSQTEMAEKRIKQMKDDSLNYTGTSKADARYCHQCDRSMPLAGCHICNPNLFTTKPDAIKALALVKEVFITADGHRRINTLKLKPRDDGTIQLWLMNGERWGTMNLAKDNIDQIMTFLQKDKTGNET